MKSRENLGPILVTGSGGGVGRNTVENLLENGYRNILCHTRKDSGEVDTLLKKFDLDPSAYVFQAELTDENQVRAMREKIEAAYGPLWALVNFAGASTNAMSWKMTLAEFNNVIGANLISTFLCTREFLPGMRNAGKGRIVNTSSVVADTGIAGASHYAASKGGIEAFTRSVALEVANKGVTVNAMSLGYFGFGLIDHVSAPLLENIKASIPLKRLGTGKEIYGMLQYLISEESSYTTGQVIHINGGLRM